MKHSRPDYQHTQEHISPELKERLLHIFSHDEVLKTAVENVLDSFHGKIPDDEPVFLFRGQDVLLPEILSYYEKLLYAKKQAGTPIYKGLLKAIHDIRQYQISVGCKIPDAPAE